MKKRISILTIAISLALLSVLCLISCTANSNSNNKPSTEELAEMAAKANEYEKNGKFASAIELYRTLYQYQYPDSDFSEYGLDKAIKVRENRYRCERIACERCVWLVKDLKTTLKDPNSLIIYNIKITDDGDTLKITFDYGAKNSFGGMVRNTYSGKYTIGDSDKDEVYTANKEFFESRGFTKEDVVKYIAGNHQIWYESQYEAIVNGTCDY